ncbi:MAG: beta-propeller fold lactonase family protein [Candidatus Cybelea sp.]
MSSFAIHRNALIIGIAAALLTACGGSQPPIGAPGAIAPDSYAQKSLGRNAHHATSVHYVYVTNAGSNDVSAFAIKASGALKRVLGSPFAAGTAPSGLAIDPTGAFLYVANSYSNNVSVFAINTSSGALTPVPGSPFAAGGGPLEVAIDPSGKFVYVTNHLPNTVSAFAVNTSSGALTQVPGTVYDW